MYSEKFEKVKSNYDKGVWTLKMVYNAVEKLWINNEEFKEITGEEYS